MRLMCAYVSQPKGEKQTKNKNTGRVMQIYTQAHVRQELKGGSRSARRAACDATVKGHREQSANNWCQIS